MKDDNFTILWDFMGTELGLSGLDKEIYAIIYGFYKNQNEFTGSLKYLNKRTGKSISSIQRSLNSLKEKRLILNVDEYINNVKHVRYSINEKILDSKNIKTINDHGGIVKMTMGYSQNDHLGIVKMTNNNKDNNIIKIKSDNKEKNHTSFLTDDTEQTYETQKPTETAQISTIIPKDVQTYQDDILSQYRPPYEPKKQFETVGHIIRKIKEEHSIDWDTFKIGCSIKNDSSMLNSAMKKWWEDRVVVRDWCNKQDVPFRDWEAVYKDIKNFIRNFAKLYYK
jgi:predicted transcriptional regulator